jgi:hypothetical protein
VDFVQKRAILPASGVFGMFYGNDQMLDANDGDLFLTYAKNTGDR